MSDQYDREHPWFGDQREPSDFEIPEVFSREAVNLVDNLLYEVEIPIHADPEEQTVTIQLTRITLTGHGETFAEALKDLEGDIRFRIADGPVVESLNHEDLLIMLELQLTLDAGMLEAVLRGELGLPFSY